MKHLRPLLLALALLPTAGCSLFSDDIEPIYEIDDDAFVVVHPFADADFDSPWQSDKGHRLAQLTTEQLAANADFRVVPYDDVMLLMHAPVNPESGAPGLDVTTLTPAQLAELTGADYVIMGDILHFELQDPRAVALHQASGRADVRLFKVAKSAEDRAKASKRSERQERIRKAYRDVDLVEPGETYYGGSFVAQGRVEGIYPDTYLGQYGESFLDRDTAFAGLCVVLSRRAAQLFYEHEPEKLGGSRE